MADTLARPSRRGVAVAVVLAGLLLALSALFPWAGIDARLEVLGAGVSQDVRGVDDPFGVYTLVAGLAAAALGVAGLLRGRLMTALAALPGVAAAVLLVMYVADPRGIADRVSVDLGVLSIEPGLRLGWFAALAAALAVTALALLALTRPHTPR
ncbi:hypothetical protein AB0B45_32485 [Nonomuraea sp. NPDC049152]|uniref:hypothetical protein n=1 Tax=Nonomuraea sp. NPDC049152 TaxID=3154350 RepID=UPI0033D7E487